MPALDAALGIRHTHANNQAFLAEMRAYMPADHRAFLADMEARPSIAAFCAKHGDGDAANGLKAAFNAVVDALATFRTAHIGIVARYIIAQQRAAARGGAASGAEMDKAAQAMQSAIQGKGKEKGLGGHAGGKGTGGTGIMTFLKPTRDETEARRLA